MENQLDGAVAGVGIKAVYQPIVSLPDEVVVGFEALTRWPDLGNPNPRSVFDRASVTDELDALDLQCIESAISGALDGELARGTMLLVNSEPGSEYVGSLKSPTVARGQDELHLVLELTEHGLLAHPQTLLRKVAAARADGFAIALDDVGAHPDSLALIDIIAPDIVKLDISLVQRVPGIDEARVLGAVLAHHERTGAVILAEGIETEEHFEQALALGADLGQGFRFGAAGPIGRHKAGIWDRRAVAAATSPRVRSPFELVNQASQLRTTRKPTLTAFSRHIERQALHAADPPMVLAALQKGDFLPLNMRKRYAEMAETSPLVAVFGEGLPADLGTRMRGVALDPSDPLCEEWTVVVLGPHFAAALIGRERSGGAADSERLFDFVITYERSMVTMAARNLLDRMV